MAVPTQKIVSIADGQHGQRGSGLWAHPALFQSDCFTFQMSPVL